MAEINFVSIHWNDNVVETIQTILDASDCGKYPYVYQHDGGEFEFLLSTEKLTQNEVEEICKYDFDREREQETITLSTGKKITY